jgi:ribosome-associated toxin RatA of RatAB toxin-antitoxin module
MDRSTSSIVIGAPAGDIMDAIADVAAYPQWAPGVTDVEVLEAFTKGRPRRVRFVLAQAGFRDEHVYIYTWDDDEQVSWHLEQPAGMVQRLEGVYQLQRNPDDGTEVTYSLAVDVSIPILGMLRRRAEKVIIDSALQGLRRRVTG